VLVSVPLPCGKCGARVEVQLQDTPKIINLDLFSMIIAEHPSQVLCGACGQALQPIIGGLAGGIAMALAPVAPKPGQSKIIIPGVTI
jgi:ribosomal protein S27AE